MTPRRLLVPAILCCLTVLLATTAGCSVAVQGQEVYLRVDPDENSARLLVIYKGIGASDAKKATVQDAVKQLEPFLDGQRRVATQGLWGTWDFEARPSHNRDFVGAARCVELVDHGLFLDQEERLCGFQEFTFHTLQFFADALNRALSRQVLQNHEQQVREAEEARARGLTPGKPGPDFLDARSYELWVERARAGGPWFELRGDELKVDLPMTEDTALALQRLLIEHATKPDVETGGLAHIIGQHAVYLRGVEHRDESLRLRFGAPDGLARFSFGGDGEVRLELRDALEDAGVNIDAGLTLEALRERM